MDGGKILTKKEISRANVFMDISKKKLSQTEAARTLDLSVRHVQRLYAAYSEQGLKSLLSRKRGKASNHQLPHFVKIRVMELLTSDIYTNFGPTLMCEKLEELHGIKIGRETTRQLMIQVGVWKVHKKKCPVLHQLRIRRARCGELVQIDGSPHAWFEGRGEPCVLIVFIDDATGRTYGKFCTAETTEIYMIVAWEYIIKYGRPLAFYSDKFSVFRVNKPGYTHKESQTQFGRALNELDIELICANSPQAKGRVEKMNSTLQDRLVKELRLANISTIEEANRFLEGCWWDAFNAKKEKAPADPEDAHRKIGPEHDLSMIFSQKSIRKVTKNLEIQYKNIIYQLRLKKPGRSMRGAQVTVIEKLNGCVLIEYKGQLLPFEIFGSQKCTGIEVNSKEINRFLKESKERKVSKDHPWKRGRCELIAEQTKKMYKNVGNKINI